MTQKDKVLRHLIDHGSITPLDAVKEYGILCLAERIRDLRNTGFHIVSKAESAKNRYGDEVHFTRYMLWEKSDG